MSPQIDFAHFWKNRYFSSLDGLRALSVLMVITFHLHVPYPSRWIRGELGVDVFFVLSGFLITTLLVREKERTGRISIKGFYIRRFFRIVPLYFLVILLYFPAVRATHDSTKLIEFRTALPWLFTFMAEYRPASAGNVLGHAWTLGVEEKFYLIWPLVVVVLYLFWRRWAIVALALIALSLWFVPPAASRAYGGLLIGSIVGIALSKSSNWIANKHLPEIPDWILCLGVVITYGLTLYNFRMVLLFSTSISLVVTSLVLRQGRLRDLLSNPVLVYIGKRSYAMYLIHVLAINTAEYVLFRFCKPNWVAVVSLSYLFSLMGAVVLHALVERPCMATGRRLSKSFQEPIEKVPSQ